MFYIFCGFLWTKKISLKFQADFNMSERFRLYKFTQAESEFRLRRSWNEFSRLYVLDKLS